MGRFSTDSFTLVGGKMRAVLPCLRKRKRLFPFMRRDVSPKIRKGKGVESSTIFNAMSFTHRGGKSSSDHRAVGGACKATAINTQKVLPLFSSIAPPCFYSTSNSSLPSFTLHFFTTQPPSPLLPPPLLYHYPLDPLPGENPISFLPFLSSKISRSIL